MPVTWDDSTDKQMLLNAIHLSGITVNWAQLAKMMGSDFTAEAVRGRFKKLRAQAKEQFGEPPTASAGGNGTKSTPKRAPVGKKATGENSSGKKRKACFEDENEDEDEQRVGKNLKTEAAADGEGESDD